MNGDYQSLDRSDWPEVQSVDFGGVDLKGDPLMQAVCPGCGLYRENDRAPNDHFAPCPWVEHNPSSAAVES